MVKAAFKKGQRCLVPHTDRYYAAQILRAQKRDDGEHHYLIHYQGWSKKYDEWVEESGLVKYDESLLPPEEQGLGPGGAGGGGAVETAIPGGAAPPGGKGGGGGTGGERSVRKRKVGEAGMEPVAPLDTTVPLQLRLHMPPLLKKVILDDHAQVTQQVRLQPLPRRPCVSDILRTFEQRREMEAGGAADAATQEIVNGLQSYFDRGLRQLLLYQQEVQQYEQAVSHGRPPRDVYGGEHLVRLLVKLPELVPVASMGAQNVLSLESQLHDLMALLVEKQAQFFLPGSAYIPNPHFEQPLALPPLPVPTAAVG